MGADSGRKTTVLIFVPKTLLAFENGNTKFSNCKKNSYIVIAKKTYLVIAKNTIEQLPFSNSKKYYLVIAKKYYFVIIKK